ncbi:hypothetical protein [Geminicoccus roseus]|uniref:hypothetical protein n=1 Tax=Geminicoccus roseus TaxID=404900 RepID=UPI00040275B3|nr:hypothetical protein [Geminicoccus roseus]
MGDFLDDHHRVKAGPNSRICKGDNGDPAFLQAAPRTSRSWSALPPAHDNKFDKNFQICFD